eukprot:3163328-Pyramimonas_sp.AAC.1
MGYPTALAADTAVAALRLPAQIFGISCFRIIHICQSMGGTIRLQIGAKTIGILQIGGQGAIVSVHLLYVLKTRVAIGLLARLRLGQRLRAILEGDP